MQIWGNGAQMFPNSVQGYPLKIKDLTSTFHVNKALLYHQGSLRVELYLFYKYLGMRELWEKWTQRPYIIWSHTRKVIQSPQLHVSHQFRLHSCVKTLWKLIYTCFTGAWTLGQFGKTGPKHLKACEAKHWKQSNAFRSTFQIKIGFILVSSKAFRELSYIYLFHRCFGIRIIWGN